MCLRPFACEYRYLHDMESLFYQRLFGYSATLLTVLFFTFVEGQDREGLFTKLLPDDECPCGIANDEGALLGVNFEPVQQVYKYPWSVALMRNNTFACGGALITPQHILTAAHCVKTRFLYKYLQNGICMDLWKKVAPCFIETSEIGVSFPTLEGIVLNPYAAPSLPMNVSDIYVHPLYRISMHSNDIAILKLEKKLSCTNKRRPICLPNETRPWRKNTTVTIASWGKDPQIDSFHRHPVMLTESQLILKPWAFCSMYAKNMTTKVDCWANLLCAIALNRGTCEGDSGSPIFEKNYFDNLNFAVGITSFHTSGQCSTTTPSFFTRISVFGRWIRSVVLQPKDLHLRYLVPL